MRLPPSGRALLATTACPTRNTPSSNAVTILANREFITLRQSFRNFEPYANWHIHRAEERFSIVEAQFRFADGLWHTGFQFFSVPQVSIALPM